MTAYSRNVLNEKELLVSIKPYLNMQWLYFEGTIGSTEVNAPGENKTAEKRKDTVSKNVTLHFLKLSTFLIFTKMIKKSLYSKEIVLKLFLFLTFLSKIYVTV